MSGEREADMTVACGVRGTGKSSFFKNECLPFNDRNLIIPANPYDKAWHGYPAIDIDKLLKDVTGLDRQYVDDLKMAKNRKLKDDLYAALDHQFWLIRGTVVFALYPSEDVLFDAVVHSKTGFKKGGLVVDDTKNWFPNTMTAKEVGALVRSLRHLETDLFLAVHKLMDCHNEFFGHEPTFMMFNTKESCLKQIARETWSRSEAEQAEETRLRVRRIALKRERPEDKYYHEPIAFKT